MHLSISLSKNHVYSKLSMQQIIYFSNYTENLSFIASLNQKKLGFFYYRQLFAV